MKTAQQLKERRMVRQYFKNGGKVTKCADAKGLPLSSCTVVPKSIRYNGVVL